MQVKRSLLFGLRLAILALLAALTACAGPAGPTAAERLGGAWSNELARYTFDTAAGTQTREALGTTETKPMTIQAETADSLTYVTDGDPITVRFVDADTIELGQAGRVPLTLTREP